MKTLLKHGWLLFLFFSASLAFAQTRGGYPPYNSEIYFKGVVRPFNAQELPWFVEYYVQLEQFYWEYPRLTLSFYGHTVCNVLPCPIYNEHPSVLKVFADTGYDQCGSRRYDASFPNNVPVPPEVQTAVVYDNYFNRCAPFPANERLSIDLYHADGHADTLVGYFSYRGRR